MGGIGFVFCPFCAGRLKNGFIDGRERAFCPGCGWVNYLNPVPVVCVIGCTEQNEVAIIKRAIEPARGEWAFPGGFVEIDETLESAAQREFKEETGLDVKGLSLITAVRQTSKRYGAVIVLGYAGSVEKAPFLPSEEAEEGRWVDVDDVPEQPFESYRAIFDAWKKRLKNAGAE